MATVNLSTEQFEKLLTTLASKRDGSFNTCRANFNGCRDSGRVEAFISAIEVFKKTENISDDDALMAIPLVLSDEAAVWWEGVKEDVKKWEDFITRLRHAFAPKKSAYMIYQDIVVWTFGRSFKEAAFKLSKSYLSQHAGLSSWLRRQAKPHAHLLYLPQIAETRIDACIVEYTGIQLRNAGKK
ncbi:unnamed protein product [Plutella xylostella]|uniref:(diamondback moth) hypothetical protein n=1 Tax=Plutella xylostella TaxID=51655 RepID=A0A8S4FES1_PLUXY|nr:unnamed protein product [Plutella xylostella]